MGYPIELQGIINWFASKADLLTGTGVTLTETAARSEFVPAARADFDSNSAIGRITFWATGAVDFEILDRADGVPVLFRHESVETLDFRRLDDAYAEFIAAMTSKLNL